MHKGSTHSREAFTSRMVQQNVAQMALDKGFNRWDLNSQSLISDIIIELIRKTSTSIKTCTEMSGRTDSNLIDALAGLSLVDKKFTKEEAKSLLKDPRFTSIDNCSRAIKEARMAQRV